MDKLVFIFALPFGEGNPKGRERCGKKHRYHRHFGEFVLPVRLVRHAFRRATFPKGEGLSAR